MKPPIVAIYPGSFDPLTNGHLDVVARGAKLVDKLIVAVLRNEEKQQPLFTVEERLDMLRETLQPYANVEVAWFNGLLMDFAREQQAKLIFRGIRAISDYEYELQIALMNRRLEPSVETAFLMAAEQYSFISSRLIKGVARLGGNISGLVPPLVEQRIQAKIASQPQ